MPNLLTANNLTFAYGDRPVLRDIDLSLSSGEVVALLGPNGSGKSTLIQTLLGSLHAQGSIEWDGKPIKQWKRRDLAKKVAYLPQLPTFEPGQRVVDSLRLGRSMYWGAFGVESPDDERIVGEVAERLSLSDLLRRPMDELSGGQRQRVFVGRCLVQKPAALLLDEPGTYLDLRHQVELFQLLRQLSKEQSIGVLLASHDLNLAGLFADRLILLHEGKVLATGTAAEVLEPTRLGEAFGVLLTRVELPGGGAVVVPSAAVR